MHNSKNLDIAKKIALSVVKVINEQTQPERQLCAKLSLSYLIDVKMFAI